MKEALGCYVSDEVAVVVYDGGVAFEEFANILFLTFINEVSVVLYNFIAAYKIVCAFFCGCR